MTEIVPFAGGLPEKIRYTEQLAHADMLPAQYRKKPANLLYAIEYAEMLGLAPMAAISGIHVIEGKPTASSALISALVRRAGHKLRVSGDDEKAVAEIIRSDDPDWPFRAEWTMARARKAGLTNKKVWQQYPAAMLKARAITEVARDACEEALSGMHYTPEELGAEVDADGNVVDQVPAQNRPGATIAEAVAETNGAGRAESAVPPERMTRMGALMRQLGVTGKEQALEGISHVLGRTVWDRAELSEQDVETIIADLERRLQSEPEQPEPTPEEESRAEVIDAGDTVAQEPPGTVDAEIVPDEEQAPADVWRDLVDAADGDWTQELMEQAFKRDHGGRHPSTASLDELSAWGREFIGHRVALPKGGAS